MPEFTPTPSRWYLGGVELDYAPLRWPFYRGTDHRLVRFMQGAQLADALKELPRETTLSVSDPFGGRLDIPCVLISVEPRGSAGVEVTIADRRWHLGRVHLPYDVNIRWGVESVVADTGEVTVEHRYVRESAQNAPSAPGGATPSTIKQALSRICGIVRKEHEGEPLPLDFEYSAAAATIAATVAPDNVLVGGMMLGQALARILGPAGLDLTVTPAGVMRIVGRKEAPEQGEALAGLDWNENRPAWEDVSAKRWDAPEKVIAVFVKRLQYRAAYVSPGNTYAPPARPHFRLYQRYQSVYGSGWVTLEELLAEVNGAAGVTGFALTDSAIAAAIYSGGWQGTVLDLHTQAQPLVAGLAEPVRVGLARQIVTVIDASWRRHMLLRVEGGTQNVVPQGTESDGYFWDMQFGTLSADTEADADEAATVGTVRPQAVRSAWVEIYRRPVGIRGTGRKADALALKFSRNFGSATTEAPFSARWFDRVARIVEIAPQTNRQVIDRRLGALTRDDGVADVSESPTVRGKIDAASRGLTGNLYIRRRDITSVADGRVECAPQLEFDVSIVAKTRAPIDDRDRFYEVEIPTGIDGGTGFAFLPADPVAVANMNPDDETTPLNKVAIDAYAKKQAEAYAAQFQQGKIGGHYAHGVAAAVTLPVDGTVREIMLECGTLGMATVLCKVELGL